MGHGMLLVDTQGLGSRESWRGLSALSPSAFSEGVCKLEEPQNRTQGLPSRVGSFESPHLPSPRGGSARGRGVLRGLTALRLDSLSE